MHKQAMLPFKWLLDCMDRIDELQEYCTEEISQNAARVCD